jgi:NAD-dependent epimerase/dehydratase family protein
MACRPMPQHSIHHYLFERSEVHHLWCLCFRASVSSSAATNSDGVNGFVDDNEPSAVQRLRPLRFDEAKAGRPVGLFKSHRSGAADGDQQRDFIYVDDTIEVILWLLSHPEVSGLFNLETGQARSFRDLVTAMFAALGPAPHIQNVDMPHSFRNTYQVQHLQVE